MDELLELKQYIEAGQYQDAMLLINDMEEMAKEDKLNKISSFSVILLLHIIKQHAEKHSTRSWDASVFAALFEIGKTNKRKKSGGHYATPEELADLVADAYPTALRRAALEAFGGAYDADELEKMIDPIAVRQDALDKLLTSY